MTVTGASTYTGNVVVNAGLLQANYGNDTGANNSNNEGLRGALGRFDSAALNRTVTVNAAPSCDSSLITYSAIRVMTAQSNATPLAPRSRQAGQPVRSLSPTPMDALCQRSLSMAALCRRLGTIKSAR